MKVLFVLLYEAYLSYYESTIRLLVERGHHVEVALMGPDPWNTSLMGSMKQRVPAVSFGTAPSRSDYWTALATAIRASQDYLRYQESRYHDARELRRRARIWPLSYGLDMLGRPPLRDSSAPRILARGLAKVEVAIPSSSTIERFLRSRAPDVLIVSPLVDIGSAQVDYIKSARALGIRTCLPVASWDNLTNKGLIRLVPDLVTVWNEHQRAEAIDLHGVPSSRLLMTGAPPFDKWFDCQPSATRREFLGRIGLPTDRPCLLYVCSSPFTTPDEVPFVREWIARIRQAPDASVRCASILVRPHPQHMSPWRNVDLGDLDNVAIWPREHRPSIDEQARADFFDSLVHSAAVIGINTSAQIEAAIAGRPVLTILAEPFRDTQQGTLHFRYLADEASGLVQVARDLDEHLSQLADSLKHPEAFEPRRQRFLTAFVRPHGLDHPSTPILVDAIEQLGSTCRAESSTRPPRPQALTPLLLPVAVLMRVIWNILGGRDRRYRSTIEA